jgi:acetylornithine deacetylase/succinyl-diaminopimelate desuccinylase-like protein
MKFPGRSCDRSKGEPPLHIPAWTMWSVLTLLAAVPAIAQNTSTDYERLGREVLKELIETNTTHSTGSVTVAAERMAARLVAAGFPKADVQVVGGTEKKRNLVTRYRGNGARKPILFIAHLDVVEARPEDWSVDPFVLIEKDGYLYGRGTLDVKGGAATLVAAFVRLRQEQWVPDRDLILALTADEEGGPDNGVAWLLANRRDLIDAEYCINVDAGGGELRGGNVTALDVQAAEKVYASFTLTVKNAGGHSSLPTKDNAIYRLSAGLQRLAAFEFPVRLKAITRAYFDRMAASAGASAADMRAAAKDPPSPAAAARLSAKSPFYNALLRTTCVATQLQAGHAENALPQTARATVNCRLLPDENPAMVQRTLERVLADPRIAVAPIGTPTPSPPSPLVPEVFKAIEIAARAVWGGGPAGTRGPAGVTIVPFMETGATDGLFLRNAGIPVYGVTGIAFDPDDVRAHGKDERILVRSFSEGLEFAYQIAKALAGPLVAGALDPRSR